MRSITGSSAGKSWQPIMTGDTSARGYWVNWRVLICSMLVLSSTALALLLIFRFEGKGKDGNAPEEEEEEEEEEGVLYEDETWKPCLTTIHPAWLLAFRIAAFLLLFALLLITASVDGPSIFYYYTQWTFTLVTIYFGLGSLLSVYGCYKHHKVDNFELDSELGTDNYKNPSPANGQQPVRKRAGFLCYAFQIIYQINAGAVVLTDCVFWFIIVPFLTIRDYNLNFLIVNMHTINAVFLLGETALNSLRFPWFRIGYFFMWTVVYVVFQWILHACVKLWWPYPFLDLASSYSPLWYLSVALMHIPCYGIFALIIKLKHHIYSTRYPNTYQCKKFPSELSRRKIREEQTKERE